MKSHRGNFTSKLGFIFAAAASAVGLGNIWKFPFEVADGGGAAFVFIYIICCLVLGFPLMMTELAFGRATKKGPAKSFESLGHKRWQGLGLMAVLAASLILSFYNVVAAWTTLYAVEMLQGNFGAGAAFGDIIGNWQITALYAGFFMLATMAIVAGGVAKGIEKASKVLLPALLLLIVVLAVYGLTLPGAFAGIEFYLIPDFSKITMPVVYSALVQAFYSLSLAMGIMLTYGSYLKPDGNIPSAAISIIFADLGIALLAGLMMFSFVYSQGLQGTSGGAGLIFTVLPAAFASFGPILGRLIGTLFFLLLMFAALSSTVSLLEVAVSYVIDRFKLARKVSVLICGLSIFVVGLLSIGSNGACAKLTNFIAYFGTEQSVSFMTFLEHIASDSLLPLNGFLMCIYMLYRWKRESFMQEIRIGNAGFFDTLLGKFSLFSVKYICPAVLLMVFCLTVLRIFFGIELI